MKFQNSLLLLVLSSFAILSFVCYQQQYCALNFAAAELQNIDLRYFKQRGVSHNSPKKLEVETDPSISTQLQTIDLLFESHPLKALALYEQLTELDPGHLGLRFRLGILYGKLEKWEASKIHLSFVHEHANSALQPDAAWFLALLEIMEGNVAHAKPLLEESISKRSNYQNEALILLQKL